MRALLISLALAALIVFASRNWVIDDRELESFAGVEIGMSRERAESILERNGWQKLVDATYTDYHLICGPGNADHYSRPSNLDSTLVIHTNDRCAVSRIVRRVR
ncbi:MAG: hypothetical protein AAFR32_02450, partial [Pseudomonadota bacterium]